MQKKFIPSFPNIEDMITPHCSQPKVNFQPNYGQCILNPEPQEPFLSFFLQASWILSSHANFNEMINITLKVYSRLGQDTAAIEAYYGRLRVKYRSLGRMNCFMKLVIGCTREAEYILHSI